MKHPGGGPNPEMHTGTWNSKHQKMRKPSPARRRRNQEVANSTLENQQLRYIEYAKKLEEHNVPPTQMVRAGKWTVPPEKRPRGWETWGVKEPECLESK